MTAGAGVTGNPWQLKPYLSCRADVQWLVTTFTVQSTCNPRQRQLQVQLIIRPVRQLGFQIGAISI
jgi:hypothetical protein